MEKLRILVIDDDPTSIAQAIEQFSDKYELTTLSYKEIVEEISKMDEDNKTPFFDVVFIENFFLQEKGSRLYTPSLIKNVCHLKFVTDVIKKGASVVIVIDSWNQGFDGFFYFIKDAFGKKFNPRNFGTILSGKTEYFATGDYRYIDQSGRKNDTKKWENVLERLPKWLVG